MPTLEFKGKQFVYSHHLSVPFRELKVVADKSLPAAGQRSSLDDDHPRRQPGGAQGAAAYPRRQDRLHLHRPALQYRQRRLVLQRQRALAADERVAEEVGQSG